MSGHALGGVEFLGFDVFGTVVDWRSGVARAATPFLERHQLDVNAFTFADQWRSLHQPAMQRVRAARGATGPGSAPPSAHRDQKSPITSRIPR